MSKQAAKIVTIEWITKKAAGLRKYLGFPATGFIHPMDVLDRIVSKPLDKAGTIFGDYEVVPDSTHFIPDGNAAYTDSDQRKIYIRERAVNQFAHGKFGPEAFDVFHEIGHLVIHCVKKDSVRIVSDDYVYKSRMEDPETQADLFAAEFYVPAEDAKKKTYGEILREYKCSPSMASRRVKECNPQTYY